MGNQVKKVLRALSTSDIYTKRLKNRTSLAGGVTVDRSVAIDRIRNSSIGLSQNILKPTESNCSFVYNPMSYGEGKNYVVYPDVKNLVSFSEDYTDSSWSKNGSTVTTNANLNPFGVNKSSYIVETTASGVSHGIFHQFTSESGTVYTASYYVKKAQDSWCQIYCNELTVWANFNFDTGLFGNVGSAGSWTATSVANGYWMLTLTFVSSTTGLSLAGILGTNNTNSVIRAPSYIGTTRQVYDIAAVQVEKSGTATTYQKTLNVGQSDFNFTRATTATATNKDGSIGGSCYNLLVNSATATTQSVTVQNTPYTLQVNGTGTYTLSGAFSGSLVGNGSLNTLTFTPTAGALTLTVSGTLTNVQLNQGSTAKDYLQTTNRLAVPRIDYSLDLTKPSLLIEPQRTNLALWSEDIGNGVWTTNFFTKNLNTTIAPNGTSTADSLMETANAGSHYLTQPISSAAGITYNWSVYLKYNGRQWVFVGINSGVDKAFYFDILNGVVGSSVGGATNPIIKNVGNGWYRCSVTVVSGGTVNTAIGGTLSDGGGAYLGDITKGYYVWGQQLETGSNATTYIPTTSATVTRNGETSYVDLQNNSLLNQNNFTLFVDGYLYDGSGATRSIALSDTTTGGTNDVGFFDGIKASFAASSVITSDSTSLSSDTAFKIAIQRSGTSVKFFRNGAQIWSTQTVAVVDYRYLIINNGGSSFAINKIELYKETLSDGVLITKTT